MNMQARHLILLTFSVCILFAGTAYGQWTQTGGPNSDNVTALAVSGPRIFAGTFAGGVFVTANNGDTWDAVNNGLTDPIIKCLAVKGTTLFAGTAGGGVFRTTDNGATWTEQNTDLTNTEVNALVTYDGFVIAGTNDGVFLSTNDGNSWIATNVGLENTSISSLVRVNNVLLAGTLVGVFRYDTQSPGPWTKASNGITSFAITALSVADTYVFAATSENLFLSKNQGNSWATAGIKSNTFVTSVGVPAANGMNVNYLVGTVGDGVYSSVNVNAGWTDISTGLTNLDVSALTVSGDFLIAATYGAGVWKRSLSEILVSSIEDDRASAENTIWLAQNFPNPVYDVTTIPYHMVRGGRVLIEVYDAVNNRIAVVEDKEQQPGTYTAPFQTLDLPSGVYFYRLHSDVVVATKHFVVMH